MEVSLTVVSWQRWDAVLPDSVRSWGLLCTVSTAKTEKVAAVERFVSVYHGSVGTSPHPGAPSDRLPGGSAGTGGCWREAAGKTFCPAEAPGGRRTGRPDGTSYKPADRLAGEPTLRQKQKHKGRAVLTEILEDYRGFKAVLKQKQTRHLHFIYSDPSGALIQ